MAASAAGLASRHLDDHYYQNLMPALSRRQSRSPRPYHKHEAELRGPIYGNAGVDQNRCEERLPTSSLTASSNGLSNDQIEASYFDADGRKRRKFSSSPSDTGTEADDESTSFLRSLPAPPLKPRKGLAAISGIEPTSSPLLTPSYLDDAHRILALQQWKRRKGSHNLVLTDDETRTARKKFTKRRRAEFSRRLTEITLISIIGFVVCGNRNIQPSVEESSRELLSHLFIVGFLVVLYPFRLLLHLRSAASTFNTASPTRIWIPAAFDPAPLLYPVFLPLLVSLSLTPNVQGLLLPNIILSLCSIPEQMIPMSDCIPGYGSAHWMCSGLPLFIARTWDRRLKRHSSSGCPEPFDLETIDSEILLCLYPLHQALLPSLRYITTTSLLPAELQLLSISLLNVLIFSTSPQAVILKALLWIGGIAMFVLCGGTLQQSLALARVPSWRFRRAGKNPAVLDTLSRMIQDRLGKRLASWRSASATTESSDSDQLEAPKSRNSFLAASRKPKEKASMLVNPSLFTGDSEPAIESSPSQASFAQNEVPSMHQLQFSHHRGHTLLSKIKSSSSPQKSRLNLLRKISKANSTKPKSFLSLTQAQAIVLKWAYALYVYLVTAAIIAGPIRRFVSQRSLEDHEPVGWALGYLFGNLPSFRSWIERLSLHTWICLPSLDIKPGQGTTNGRAERIRKEILGEANTRLLICGYCAGVIFLGLAIVFRLRDFVEVDSRRKIFHGMMVGMFLPITFIDPAFAALALVIVLAIFLILDLFRAAQLPPLSKPLTHFLAPYVDGRDHRGPVVVSHIFLLVGCAIPLWLSLAFIGRGGISPWEGWEVPVRDLSMVGGVVCVGMGDAAASLIGRRFGRRRWPWSGGKSLEGSLAFVLAVVLGLILARAWLIFGQWSGDCGDSWALTMGKAVIAGVGASLTEAVLTGGNDNVVVPVILWLVIRGLEM